MRNILTILSFLFSLTAQSQAVLFIGKTPVPSTEVVTYPDSAQFNFSSSAQAVTDFTNIINFPHLAVRSGTGTYGIGINTIATGRWTPLTSQSASNNSGEVGSFEHFPSGVSQHQYFNAPASPYTTSTPHFEITGLVAGAAYTIYMIGSRLASGVPQASRLCDYYVTGANGDQSYLNYNVKGNTTQEVVFTNVIADSNGKIFVTVTSTQLTNGVYLGHISGIAIKRTPR